MTILRNKNTGKSMGLASPAESTSCGTMMTLDGQICEMYGRAAYTHKTHEKMADIYVRRYKLLKVIEITLSAITTSSLLIAIYGDVQAGVIVGAALSTLLLAVTLYFKEASLGEKAQKHSAVASKLWGMRERLLSLLVDMRNGRAGDEIRRERDQVNDALEVIYHNAPRTNAAAYKAAQQALKNDEELFFSEEELNKMLPRQLRTSLAK